MKAKICTKCNKRYSSTAEFFRRNRTKKDGLDNWCKKCHNQYQIVYRQENKEKRRQYQERYYRQHKQEFLRRAQDYRVTHKEQRRLSSRKHLFKTRYNLTLGQHKQLYINQNGCCAICQNPIPYAKMHTDHNHATGKVRGLLCFFCNSRLAYIEDVEFVRKAKQYLRAY